MMDRLDSDYATSVPFPSPSHHIPVPSPFAAQRGGNRREEVTNGVNERRTWKRLTFPFPFVHHQSHDLKESCM